MSKRAQDLLGDLAIVRGGRQCSQPSNRHDERMGVSRLHSESGGTIAMRVAQYMLVDPCDAAFACVRGTLELAHQFIIDTVNAHPDEVTIIAVGRMTNLGLALRQDPSIAKKVKQVIIMGGAFGYKGRSGNVTPLAEANIHGDPVAADEMFAAEWPVVAVGLDVTHDVLLDKDYLAALARDVGENGELLRQMCEHYANFYNNVMGFPGVVGHDLLAVTYALFPEWFETRKGPIVTIRDGLAVGQTAQMPESRKGGDPAWNGRPHQTICTAVDAEKVLAHFRDTVSA